jgi:hypothetical protein
MCRSARYQLLMPGCPTAHRAGRSSTRHEGDHDVRRMPVEALAAVVVDGRRPGIGMSGGDLHFAQWDSCLESAHDEGRPQHVGVYVAKPGSLGGRTDPPVGGTPVEPTAVVAEQDRPSGTFPDCQVDRSGRSGHQGDDRRLVALADDAECPVTPLEPEILDVGRARLADPQAVQSESTARAAWA